ncbi:hypothetical protein Tco_1153435 [Tanacetum coccineum]
MDTKIPQSSGHTEHLVDKAVYKERDDSLVRAATTASSLKAEQDSHNITKTRSKATLNEPSPPRTSSGSGPKCQETMRDTIAQTRFENVSNLSYDPLLTRGNTLRSGEDSLKLKELMELCTNLQNRVLDLEKTKTTKDNEIVKLKMRVKKVKQKKSLGEDASKQGRNDAEMFDMDTLTSDEVVAEQEVATKDVNLTVDEVTLAQALAALKSDKPKLKGDVIVNLSVPVSTASTKVSTGSATTMDKGKPKMVEPELVKKLLKKDQLKLDEDLALKLHAEIDEEERIARAEEEKINEANIA